MSLSGEMQQPKEEEEFKFKNREEKQFDDKAAAEEEENEQEDSLKQELVVRRAIRAAAFLSVVVAELDLPELDDFILMLSNQFPVDVTPPTTLNDDSGLESGIEADAYQQDSCGTNGNCKKNKIIIDIDIVENGRAVASHCNSDYSSSSSREGEMKKNEEKSEWGEEMSQLMRSGKSCCSEDAENLNAKETVDFERVNEATTCMIREGGECADNKVVQQATAAKAEALPRPTHIWTDECRSKFGEWLDPRECIFCHDVGDSIQAGRLLPFEDSQWVHVNCLTWSSEVYESSSAHGELRGAHTARSRSKMLRCSVCGERGATIDCQRKLCKLIFHFPCAVIANIRFCKDRTAWCNFHANSVPTARQKMVADFPTVALDAKSVNCDIAKHLRIAAPFKEILTGSGSGSATGIPLTGGRGGEAKHQVVGGNMKPASIASQKKGAAAALTTSPPGGSSIQTNLPPSSSDLSSATSLSPPPPPPPADFTLSEVHEEGKGSTACCLRVGAVTVYSLGELRPERPGTVSRTHLFPVGFTSMRLFWSMEKCSPPRRSLFVCQVLDSADDWSAPLAPSGHYGVFFRISEAGTSWTGNHHQP